MTNHPKDDVRTKGYICPVCNARLNGVYYKSNDNAANILLMCPRAIGEVMFDTTLRRRVMSPGSLHRRVVFYVEYNGALKVYSSNPDRLAGATAA